MEHDIVIAHNRILDNITIEEQFNYSTYTTIGLTKQGDFYVKIEFNNLDLNNIGELATLYKLNKALKFTSDLIRKEGYNITHIVAEKLQTSNSYSMTWECLSDEPGLSLIIE